MRATLGAGSLRERRCRPCRPSLNIAEVSCLVGFSDTSALFKAFKRWTGKKPGEYRAALAV